MDEELQKRNTDCVYFLASPLTCKKGTDCEYRHSEIARLNPRDCWYWLSGDCVNPTCAFRHPPLDGHAGVPSESAQCSAPVNKTNAPCYFYFNGFCNKGDRCSFMHGSDGNAPAGKSTKTASASTDAPFVEKKISAGNETQLAQTETHLNPSESVPKVAINSNSEFKEGLEEPVPNNVSQQCASPQIAVCGYDEAPAIRSESLLIADGFIQSRSHFEADQSSEEQVEDDIEPEERWESSPGFDVLVGDKSENLGYDDNAEYLLDLDREQRELSSHFLGYDFEDPVMYDPTHADLKHYERDIDDGYDPDDKHLFNNVRRDPGHSRDSMLDSILFRKRKHVPMELTVGDHNGMDLRDHLRRRRVTDGCPITGLSRRHGSSRLIGRSQERPRDDDDSVGNHKGNSGNENNDINKQRVVRTRSPPRHRHDGTSPLPLGMDWSPPPRKWDGRDTVWPLDFHSGWSFCVTIPSWVFLSKSRGSDPVVFYRVQVGIQSPEGITTTRGILRRFNDFLELFSEVKKVFPMKNVPPAPPRRIFRKKSRTLLEERRCSLEDWMEKLLSDIDLSRSAPVATFLELEAAARSSFNDENQEIPNNSSTSEMFPSSLYHANSDVSLFADSSFIASDLGHDTPYEISEVGSPRHGNDSSAVLGMENSISEQDLIDPTEMTARYGMNNRKFIQGSLQRFSRRRMHTGNEGNILGRDEVIENTSNAKPLRMDGTEFFPALGDYKLDGHVRRLSAESVGSDLSSLRASEISNIGAANLFGDFTLDHSEGSEALRNTDSFENPNIQLPRDALVALPSDQRLKLNRVLVTMQRRLATAKTDLEDLIARLNQEATVRKFLTTKVKDLEVELETTRQNCIDNMQQAVLTERERFTQMQWDVEELRSKCLELELKLKTEQDEKVRAESTKTAVIQENKMLMQDLDDAREQIENLQKQHEEFEVKSKADVKLLIKEVKSLRNSQLELKQDLSRVMKEKLEVERFLHKERQRMELASTANAKLLHECGILRDRLQECSVNFLVEEEDKLIVDTSLPSDAIDLLTTSDNRIGLLLAEAQLLAQDVENAVAALDETRSVNGNNKRTTDDELRIMLADVFVDNATLRKQVNSVIRCAVNTTLKSEKDDDDDDEEEVPVRKTVLSKFLER